MRFYSLIGRHLPLLLLAASLGGVTLAHAQQATPAVAPQEKSQTAQPEVMPSPLNLAEVANAMGYPEAARAQNIEGKVIVKALVGVDGLVQKHEILRSPSQLLTEVVVAHLADLRFTPAQGQGKTVSAWVTIPFQFALPAADKEKH